MALVTAGRAAEDRSPHIGYLYPAGGQVGTALRLTIGGQYLQAPARVYIAGAGVTAEVLEWVRPLALGNIYDTARHVQKIKERRAAEAAGRQVEKKEDEDELPKLPDHPLLRGLEEKPNAELDRLLWFLFNPKRQPNPQIDEEVLVNVNIDPTAAPGEREIRLETAGGLTNPLRFQVGTLPEHREPMPTEIPPAAPPVLDLPLVLNGQILPGEVDRYRFFARRGQKLVVQVQARRLVPYVADAVPGWFQAAVALYDQAGQELVFSDDYRFDPDPVFLFRAPSDGAYELAIRDALYRGRADFVYRVTVAERPFVTSLFPLGGTLGKATQATAAGWNLPDSTVRLDTTVGPRGIHEAALVWPDGSLSNDLRYAVDSLPECEEVEPNNQPDRAQRVELPRIVNGRVAAPGDIDIFEFAGAAGEEVVAEVTARRLNTPLDSLVRLTDAAGTVVAWNDDSTDPEAGLVTHQADSYLRVRLPADGVYRVEVSDAQGQGGAAYGYRLRLSRPQPDFALYVTPSAINVPVGRVAPVTVHAVRKDGFDGDIELAFAGPDHGLRLSGAWVPRGRDRVRLTITAPDAQTERPIALHLDGHAEIDGQAVVRPVVPADYLEQAFIYRHLVPAVECLVSVTKPTIPDPAGTVTGPLPVRIPAGGATRVKVETGKRPDLTGVEFDFSEPPKGVTLGEAKALDDGVEFVLQAPEAQVGYADNLIIEVFWAGQGQRYFLGLVPAIPFEIVPER